MPEQGSIVCPDCGAVYQCTPEQSGKLLHCKCGRYLVAGGTNHKRVSGATSAKPPIEAPKAEPTIAAKNTAPSAPKASKPEVPKSTQETVAADEAPPAESKHLLSVAIAVVAILVVGAGFFVLRPMTAAKASKPQVVEATVPVANTPAPCSTVPFRLENGTQIAHSMLGSGMGKLEIENAMPTDAVVRITGSANLTVEWVYVQQGQKVSFDNVPLGTHKVMISSGSDWDTENLNFKCNDSYAELEKPLDYTDRREDDRTTYSAYHLVLGKQRTAMITKDDFFMGHIGAK